MRAAKAQAFDERLPTDVEIESANHLRTILASQIKAEEPTRFRLAAGRDEQAEVVLAPRVAQALLQFLRYVGSGRAVTIIPMEEMLTTQQAADMLNVSRPYLIKLLEQEVLPHQKVGRHRRVRAEDLFAYKKKRDSDRAGALAALAADDADLI